MRGKGRAAAGLALLAVGGFAVGAWGADLEDSPWAVLIALVLAAGLALVGLLHGGREFRLVDAAGKRRAAR